MGEKIYVGNLSFSVDEKQLIELFSPYGKISEAVIITDKFSGRSKGFGFVTFDNNKSVQKAISEMNDKEVEGRTIKVSEARPMESRE